MPTDRTFISFDGILKEWPEKPLEVNTQSISKEVFITEVAIELFINNKKRTINMKELANQCVKKAIFIYDTFHKANLI